MILTSFGSLAYGGLLAIVAALVLILIAFGLPPWAAALLGGVLVAGIGYLLIRSGLAALKPLELAPRKTIETLKEDAQWLGSGEVGEGPVQTASAHGGPFSANQR